MTAITPDDRSMPAVHLFTQQIGVPVVPGVLLDHVREGVDGGTGF